jgi:hypothetical protein
MYLQKYCKMEQIYEIIDRLRVAVEEKDWDAVEKVVESLEEIDPDREKFFDSNYFNADE